jgi:nitroimidazol reductase NimA-like FMN-containing flavoprotein (pyridoxamine 5'-phosphate oxidase superfamily)
MSKGECLGVLARVRLARLGCARENQPYIVPVYLAYEATGCLYGFTTPGQKVEWMRTNPLVCVEVDEVATPDQWVSVIAFGRYEELPEAPVTEGAYLRAPEIPRHVAEAAPVRPGGGRQRRLNEDESDDGRSEGQRALATRSGW